MLVEDEMIRKTRCPVEYVAIYIDAQGALLVARFKTTIEVHNAKKALGNLMKVVDNHVNTMQVSMERTTKSTLRPLDEVDKERIEKWVTVSMCKPEPEISFAEIDAELGHMPTADELSRRPQEDQICVQQPLMIATMPSQCRDLEEKTVISHDRLRQHRSYDAYKFGTNYYRIHEELKKEYELATQEKHLYDMWNLKIKFLATVVLMSAGDKTGNFTWIRCRHTARREKLLLSRLCP